MAGFDPSTEVSGRAVGDAIVGGSATGTAYHFALVGDAFNQSTQPGGAVRDGAGLGSAQRGGRGAGSALRVGAGSGDAWRDGSGVGDAWRLGPGPGTAYRLGIGDGHAYRAGAGPGDACRMGEGNGRAVVGAGVCGMAVRPPGGPGGAVVFSAVGHAVAPGGAWRAPPPSPGSVFAAAERGDSFRDRIYRARLVVPPGERVVAR